MDQILAIPLQDVELDRRGWLVATRSTPGGLGDSPQTSNRDSLGRIEREK